MTDRSPNLENLLQMGINAAKTGNQENARLFLQQVLDADNKNDRAWLWMAYVTDKENEIDRRRYLKTAIRINPNNRAARNALEKLDRAQVTAQNKTMTIGLMILTITIVVGVLACVLAIAIS